MLLRDDLVEELDRVVRMAPEAVDRAQLDRLLSLGGREDQTCHAQPHASALRVRGTEPMAADRLKFSEADGVLERCRRTRRAGQRRDRRLLLAPSREALASARDVPLPRRQSRCASTTQSPHESEPRRRRRPAAGQPPPRRAASPSAPRSARTDERAGRRRDAAARPRAPRGGRRPSRARCRRERAIARPRRRRRRAHRPGDPARRRRARARGLFELVPSVARRALELGLAAREPSFHVFVAADARGDDRGRHRPLRGALRERTRPTADDIVYVHDFDHPEAPQPLILPPGVGPALVAGDGRAHRASQGRDPRGRRGATRFKRAQAQARARARGARTGRSSPSSSRPRRRSASAFAPVQGGVQTFPDPARQAGQRRAVRRRSTSRRSARSTEPEEQLTREVEKAAQLVREQSARLRGGARRGVLEAPRRDHHRRGDRRSSSARSRELGEDVRALARAGAAGAHRGLGRPRRAWRTSRRSKSSARREDAMTIPSTRRGSIASSVNLLVVARAGRAAAGHLRDEPDVSEPLRLPRAARALRRAAHGLHAHPRGVAPQGVAAACSSCARPIC